MDRPSHTRRLASRTALITGATQGIGRATARLFAEQGCALRLLARDPARLDETSAELRAEYGADVRGAAVDVRDIPLLHDTIAAWDAETPIDIAVLNAGIGQFGPFYRSPWHDIEPVLRTNIDGALAAAHAVLPGMTARRRGSVVFVSSVLGKRAIQWNAAYCASKFALNGFADALRLEVRRSGVHVGLVMPARTRTSFFENMRYSVPQHKRRAVPDSDPSVAARAILRNVLHRRRETVVSLGGILYARLGLHFPRISDLFLTLAVPDNDKT